MLPADRTAATRRAGGFHTLLVEPDAELGPVESDEAPNLQIGEAALGEESLNVTRGKAQHLGEPVDVDEGWRECRR